MNESGRLHHKHKCFHLTAKEKNKDTVASVYVLLNAAENLASTEHHAGLPSQSRIIHPVVKMAQTLRDEAK